MRVVCTACAFAALAACGGTTSSGAGGSATGCTSAGVCAVDPIEAPIACDGPQERFASLVVEVSFGEGAGFGQDLYPDVVFGPPVGAGELAGSLDVLTLGDGGSIALGFAGGGIADGEGPDFVVFENPFWVGGNEQAPFAELGRVEVSDDGETWIAFPCSAEGGPPWEGCAGWRPVHAGPEQPDLDPLNSNESGGEAFDLADLGLASARFVRVTDLVEQPGRTFDLDAVGVVHPTCP